MPPIAKTTCRVKGCENPRHIYPKSGVAIYCDQHLYLKSNHRKGEINITGPMRDVLHYLLDAKRAGFPFQELAYPLAHGKTLKRLYARDWISWSNGIDHVTKYAITSRGEEMLAYYETMINRPDGICPRCEVAERHIRSSGHKDGYCIDCLRERSAEKRARGGDLGDVDRSCSRCHKRSRHQYPNGKYSTYCQHCEAVNRRRNARKNRKLIMKSIHAGGEIPLCQHCKARPCVVFRNSFSRLCAVCKPIIEKRQKLQRRLIAHGLVERL